MDKIKEIKDSFSHLENLNEENIKIKIVVEILKVLGYDFETFDLEHQVYHRKKIADIAIKISDKEYFYVEVKNEYDDLSKDDIMKLVDYLSAKSIQWGLLTKWREFLASTIFKITMNLLYQGNNLRKMGESS